MSDVILYQILRAKAGEASGVAALSPRTKSFVRPMYDFPHIDEADGGGDQLSMFMTTIARSWGTEAPLYFDLSRFDPDRRTAAGIPLVTHLFDVARQAHVKAIPVAGPLVERKGVTGEYLKGLARAARCDGRGVAIRIPFQDIVVPERLPALIDEVQLEMGIDDGQCDVFLDFGPTDSLPGGYATAHAVLRDSILAAAKALARRRLRALIFCASSIPKKTHGRGPNAPSKIVNVEFQVWSELQDSKNLRHIRFGDYGPRFAHQTDKRAKARAPARIHLTTDRSHALYVASGSSYRELAKAAAGAAEFAAQRGTWGRSSVQDAGLGSRNVGNATEWVARDVHMHIETLLYAVESRMREARGETEIEIPQAGAEYGQQYLPMT